jgi:uncharacterized protein
VTLSVGALWIHPLKSGAALCVPEATLGPRGLVGDRELMVVDLRGEFLTQREHPELARIVLDPIDGTRFELRLGAGLEVSPSGPPMPVTVWGDHVIASDCGDGAAQLLSAALGRPVRLVGIGPSFDRPVDPSYAGGEDRVSFADGFPVLVTTSASVAAAAALSGSAADARRFRPNVVIDGAEPFAEDGWHTLRIGDVQLELVKPCSRCQVLDVDPDTGTRAPGLLAAITPSRRRGNRVLFGQNALVRRCGALRVGDPCSIELA